MVCRYCVLESLAGDPNYPPLLYKLGWVKKNGRPKGHIEGVTPVPEDAINAFRKNNWLENFDWSL